VISETGSIGAISNPLRRAIELHALSRLCYDTAVLCNDIHAISLIAPAAVSKRTNAIIDKDTCRFRAESPGGERSRAICFALPAWVTPRRSNAAGEMDAMRKQLPLHRNTGLTS
jgi:hypothetical protein